MEALSDKLLMLFLLLFMIIAFLSGFNPKRILSPLNLMFFSSFIFFTPLFVITTVDTPYILRTGTSILILSVLILFLISDRIKYPEGQIKQYYFVNQHWFIAILFLLLSVSLFLQYEDVLKAMEADNGVFSWKALRIFKAYLIKTTRIGDYIFYMIILLNSFYLLFGSSSKLKWVFGMLTLLDVVLSSGRTFLLLFLIPYLLMTINFKRMIIIVTLFVSAFGIIHVLRFRPQDNQTMINSLVSYTALPIIAFDSISESSDPVWDFKHTLRLADKIKIKITGQGSAAELVHADIQIGKYVGNVYTFFFPYYFDGGYLYILAAVAILALLANTVYVRMGNDSFLKLFYVIIVYIILMFWFQDSAVSLLSAHLQYLAIFLLCRFFFLRNVKPVPLSKPVDTQNHEGNSV